jgi:hypothetical protein
VSDNDNEDDLTENDLIEALETTTIIANAIAREHRHNCPVGRIARTVRDGCINAREQLAGGSGPAQVATSQYRANWDNIFGNKQTVGSA